MRESSALPKTADQNKSMNHVNLQPNCVTVLSPRSPIFALYCLNMVCIRCIATVLSEPD